MIGRVRVGCNIQWDSQDMLPRECDIWAEKLKKVIDTDRYLGEWGRMIQFVIAGINALKFLLFQECASQIQGLAMRLISHGMNVQSWGGGDK